VKDVEAGETRPVSIELSKESFTYWDVPSASFKVDSGKYEIYLADSSRNFIFQSDIEF